MSRAFVKEDGPDNAPLPDLPISPHPNYVTLRGHTALQDRLAKAKHELTQLRGRPDRLDRNPERAAERDIRYLEARLASAIPVATPCNPVEVAFATRVTVIDSDDRETSYEITGEDEADPTIGRIAPHSPLARALIGTRVGDSVDWRRPSGTVTLEVLNIDSISEGT